MSNFRSFLVGLFFTIFHASANPEATEPSCVINVKPGWNSISVPVETNATVDELFGHLMRGRVWRWVGQNFEPLEVISRLDPKTGYWLYSDIADVISLDDASLSESAMYRAINGTWSQATHPSGFPDGATFLR